MVSRWSLIAAVALVGSFFAGPPVSAGTNAASSAPPIVDAVDAARQVDLLLRQELPPSKTSSAAGPVKRIDDEAFLRRVSLDLVGVQPTAAEVTAFALMPSADKRQKTVQKLLASAAFGENWGRYWRDVMMYRKTDERAALAAAPLKNYLTEQFNKDVPWDQIARSFITATGDAREQGTTGLIISQFADPNDVTAEVSRIFLGVQIQCAQCHDHPTDRWKRAQFHELAAFFPRVGIRPKMDGDKRTFEVVSVDRDPPVKGKANVPRGSTEHYMPDLKNPTAKGTLMQPVFFVTGQKLPSGKTDKERRGTLADWVTSEKDPWFAKAFVNRLWSELIGEGFYEPIDDLGPDRQCSAPKTLDYLAGQFATHHYDVKWLFTALMSTDEYQRESRSRRTTAETPFVANCTQRLRADQLYNSLIVALGVDDPSPDRAGKGKAQAIYARASPRAQFNQVFGYDPSMRRDEVAGSIPQALLLMNGPSVNRAIDGRSSGTNLGKLLSSTSDNEAVATELYLRCLAREPKPQEIKTCLEHVKAAPNRAEAFEDILWALVNSTEFLHRK